MWVASFLRLILASRYQVGVWPIEVFPHSQTHGFVKNLARIQDFRGSGRIWPDPAKVPDSGQNRHFWGQNLGSREVIFKGSGGLKSALFLENFREKKRDFSGF